MVMNMYTFEADYQGLEQQYDACEKRYEELDLQYDKLKKCGDLKRAKSVERESIFWMERCADLSRQMAKVEYARDEALASSKIEELFF